METYNADEPLTFGPFQGRKMSELPSHYLRVLIESSGDSALVRAAQEEVAWREREYKRREGK